VIARFKQLLNAISTRYPWIDIIKMRLSMYSRKILPYLPLCHNYSDCRPSLKFPSLKFSLQFESRNLVILYNARRMFHKRPVNFIHRTAHIFIGKSCHELLLITEHSHNTREVSFFADRGLSKATRYVETSSEMMLST